MKDAIAKYVTLHGSCGMTFAVLFGFEKARSRWMSWDQATGENCRPVKYKACAPIRNTFRRGPPKRSENAACQIVIIPRAVGYV